MPLGDPNPTHQLYDNRRGIVNAEILAKWLRHEDKFKPIYSFMLSIPITLLDPAAKVPTRAHDTDAGYDLYALEDGFPLRPGERALVRTGIAISVPAGYYARIAPRSGLAVRCGIDVLAGVVDSGFLGELKVVLINLSQDPFWYKAGDRIAQLIIEKCHDVSWEVVDTLDQTARSSGGFGSSGS